jgi:hypothetical protein
MHHSDQSRLAEALRRDQLTSDDEASLQAYLANHPDERHFWEEELALNQLLRQLPKAAVSSNFTARVMQALRQQQSAARLASAAAPGWWQGWTRERWLPTSAIASAVLCLAIFSYHQHQVSAHRELAHNLAEISRITPGVTVDVLVNFEAIEKLSQVPRNDDRELVAALQ